MKSYSAVKQGNPTNITIHSNGSERLKSSVLVQLVAKRRQLNCGSSSVLHLDTLCIELSGYNPISSDFIMVTCQWMNKRVPSTLCPAAKICLMSCKCVCRCESLGPSSNLSSELKYTPGRQDESYGDAVNTQTVNAVTRAHVTIEIQIQQEKGKEIVKDNQHMMYL